MEGSRGISGPLFEDEGIFGTWIYLSYFDNHQEPQGPHLVVLRDFKLYPMKLRGPYGAGAKTGIYHRQWRQLKDSTNFLDQWPLFEAKIPNLVLKCFGERNTK